MSQGNAVKIQKIVDRVHPGWVIADESGIPDVVDENTTILVRIKHRELGRVMTVVIEGGNVIGAQG
ncbi:MAG: hypothetical protein KGN01_03345 [Patescibacteria group bacterium]|nr:hypothetical protein [Patescibacteria group bacterium]